jgi:hypothetical protein
MSMNVIDFPLDGYKPGPPTVEAGLIDTKVAKSTTCKKCGGSCHYEGWHKPGSYIALAVCNNCGHVVEFFGGPDDE